MTERTLDRRVSFDPRSRSFPIRTLVTMKPPRSYTWALYARLDQGREGACVGFACAHELAARPVVIPGIDDDFARRIYVVAQRLDEWPGEDYEGTSVLAGMKALQGAAYVEEYRWAFGLDDLILAVGYAGPAVLGVGWRASMFETQPDGMLKVEGPAVGGHAIICRGVSIKRRQFRLTNSWGPGWGVNGDAFVSFDDMHTLLMDDGEAAIPIRRRRP